MSKKKISPPTPPEAGSHIIPVRSMKARFEAPRCRWRHQKPTRAASNESDSGRSSPALIGRAGEEGAAAGWIINALRWFGRSASVLRSRGWGERTGVGRLRFWLLSSHTHWHSSIWNINLIKTLPHFCPRVASPWKHFPFLWVLLSVSFPDQRGGSQIQATGVILYVLMTLSPHYENQTFSNIATFLLKCDA